MFEMRISTIVIAVVAVISIIKGIRDIYHYMHYTLPHQLAQLVQQAHSGQAFQTEWNIQVSPEMRDALCAPLTPQQLEVIRAAGDDIIRRSVTCYVLSHKHKSDRLSGVVKVSIQISSRSGKYDFNFPDVKLRIIVSALDHRWAVASVEIVS